ncbi:MAG: FtsX-like permease family protein [Oscillospiraceae bacterium]
MGKTYRKNSFRTVRQTFGRFGSIFAIVALGVGFLAGLMSTTPDIRYSLDANYDAKALYDIRVQGDLGLTEKDVSAIKNLEGVAAVMPAYAADALVSTSGGNSITTRFHSLPEEKNGGASLNNLELVDGRLPEKNGECIVIQTTPAELEAVKIGETIQVLEKNKNRDDIFAETNFKVVGIAHSPQYFSGEKEYTNVGSGTVDLVAFTPAGGFVEDFFTDLYVTVSGAADKISASGGYDKLVEETLASIENISGERCKIRQAEVISEAEIALADGEKEFDAAKLSAEEKLSAAALELQNGRRELQNGEKTLADGLKKLEDGGAELDKNEKALNTQEADAKAGFLSGEKRLAEAQTELDKNSEGLKQKLAEAEKSLAALGLNAAQNSAFGELRRVVAANPGLLNELQALETKGNRLKTIGGRLKEIGGLPPEQQAQFAEEAGALNLEATKLRGEISAISAGEGFLAYQSAAKKLAQLGGGEASATALNLGALDAAKAELSAGQAALDSEKAALNAQKAPAMAQIAEGRKALNAARSELLLARNEYNSGVRSLEKSRAKLQEGEAKFAEESKKAETELAAAEKKITDAKEKIGDLTPPKWYVQTREDNVSYSAIRENTDKVEAIAKIFPVLFFLVAALVALTTMTRMVEDERLQIGTMKALGYSRGAIMSKYLLYALSASVLGSLVGLGVGFRLFPTVLWSAYTQVYVLPELHCPIIWEYALSTTLVAVGCTLAATLYACFGSLRERPANLMLPRAPEPGKRILLERCTPIWKRLKFTYKVTARNIFRYKKRFFMTIIGIAGCTALLVAGFGLRDSFSDVVNRQFGEITGYDILAPLDENQSGESAALQAVLQDKSLVSDSRAVYFETLTAKANDEQVELSLLVPKTLEDLEGFATLRKLSNGKPLPIDENSVIITQKAGEILKLSPGDSLELVDKNGEIGRFKISGICENYVQNYIYMSQATCKAAYGESFEDNMLLIRQANDSEATKNALGAKLLESGGVKGVRYMEDAASAITGMLGKIDLVVLLIIISAGVLALVVLYNLTNINISERVKEIATIKVLGFTDTEVYSYVNRESLLLAAIGAIVGLVLGFFLHKFVMMNAESAPIMFGRSVKWLSYVLSALLTIGFCFVIDLFMRRKLRGISMVESMKAPE